MQTFGQGALIVESLVLTAVYGQHKNGSRNHGTTDHEGACRW